MPLKDMSRKSSRWVLVINNPVASDEEAIGRARAQGWDVRGQKEIGKKTGTPHYQIYIKTPHIRASQVKKMFPRGYIDIANGTETNNLDYVEKEETRVGDLPSTIYPSQMQFWDLLWQHMAENGFTFSNPHTLKEIHKTGEEYIIRNNLNTNRLSNPYHEAVYNMIHKGNVVESIAVNPQTLSAWKNYPIAILYRSHRRQTDRQTANILVSTTDITNGSSEEVSGTTSEADDEEGGNDTETSQGSEGDSS
jgi:hypothetical protein